MGILPYSTTTQRLKFILVKLKSRNYRSNHLSNPPIRTGKMISTTQGQQVIQTANGQQIIVQNMSQQPNQVQIQNGSEIPQIQVLPVNSVGGQQQIVLQQGGQQPQIIQTTDGQTLIYQPVQVDGQGQQQIQQANIQQGNMIQLPGGSNAAASNNSNI